MAQQTINVGAAPNDGTGTPLRTAFQYTNSNFTELYTAVGPSGNNIVVPGSATITGALTVDTTTLVVNPSGYADRVGIGTATPGYDLEIAGTVRSSLAIRGNFAGGTDIAHLRFVNANGSVVGDIFSQNTNGGASDSAYLSFNTTSSGTSAERYRIGSDGTSTWSVGGTTAMTLNSTGLGVGVTPANDKLLVLNSIGINTSSNGDLSFRNSSGTAQQRIRYSDTDGSLTIGSAQAVSYAIYFGGNTTTRAMTLAATGNLLVGTTTDIAAVRMQVWSADSNNTAYFRNSNATTPYGPSVKYTAATPNNTSSEFLYCEDSTALRVALRSNGGIANYQANNVSLSDSRMKSDIKPLGSYWNKIKSLEVVTFKYNDQTHSDDNIGLIAQQVESVAPELVDVDGFGETPVDGVPLKTIYTTDLYHAAIKALQEAMTRIEVLESKLA